MRTAFIQALEKSAETDPRIMLVVGDLGFGVVEKFAERFPKQFLNAGVAEQNMAGIAAGMSLSGKIVFTYSIANFPTLRCLEQIRNDICYNNANVKVVSVGAGLAYGALGASHQATEDIAILRALPNMTVVSPADPLETTLAVQALIMHNGPGYLRLGKAGEPAVHNAPIDFRLGHALQVRDGRDLTIITTGAMLHPALKACENLQQRGIAARVLSMHTIKPIDEAAILKAADETPAILTIEEHNIIGGLGGAVAEVLSQKSSRKVLFKMMGLHDTFCRHVGSHDHLRKMVGLTTSDIEAAAEKLLGAQTLPR